MKDSIEALRFAGISLQKSEEFLAKAQNKANESGENVYICYDIGCVYYVYHSFLTMSDDVITHVEPIKN